MLPKASNNGMYSVVKEQFSTKLNAVTRNSAEDLRWHHFTMGSVRAVPYKDVTRWRSRSKMLPIQKEISSQSD